MTASPSQMQDRLVSAYRSGGRLVLLFDYDGTLVALAPHPELAVLDGKGRHLLANLARLPRVSVGVISGRSLDDLEGMVGLENLHYAGVSGLELDLGGTRIQHPSANPAVVVISHVIEQLEATLADFPGAWIENKRFGMTVHLRDLDPDLVPELRACVLQVVQRVAPSLRVVDGPLAIEITPGGGAHKGSAIYTILQFLGSRDATCLYAGDEANDKEAFEEVASRGGICIGIGAHSPHSTDVLVDTPADLFRILEGLCEQLHSPL